MTTNLQTLCNYIIFDLDLYIYVTNFGNCAPSQNSPADVKLGIKSKSRRIIWILGKNLIHACMDTTCLHDKRLEGQRPGQIIPNGASV